MKSGIGGVCCEMFDFYWRVAWIRWTQAAVPLTSGENVAVVLFRCCLSVAASGHQRQPSWYDAFHIFYALADNLQYRLYDNMQRVKTLRTVTDVLVFLMLF